MTIVSRDQSIVILTGAGISKESGLSTFRDKGGIWSTVRVEDVATPEAFARDPDRVHDFYNMRRRLMVENQVEPNVAHEALVRLEKEWPAKVLVITQNVDDLHERAGTETLLHMHGRHREVRCNDCDFTRPWQGDLSTKDVCDGCGKAGALRPNVVWFGEMPLHLDQIQAALTGCGLFASIGTSGSVYPAAGFVHMVRNLGNAHTVELNLEPSEGATSFVETRYGCATEMVPAWVDELLA
jgi:NAD-dependent deacetylase